MASVMTLKVYDFRMRPTADQLAAFDATPFLIIRWTSSRALLYNPQPPLVPDRTMYLSSSRYWISE